MLNTGSLDLEGCFTPVLHNNTNMFNGTIWSAVFKAALCSFGEEFLICPALMRS